MQRETRERYTVIPCFTLWLKKLVGRPRCAAECSYSEECTILIRSSPLKTEPTAAVTVMEKGPGASGAWVMGKGHGSLLDQVLAWHTLAYHVMYIPVSGASVITHCWVEGHHWECHPGWSRTDTVRSDHK